MPMFRKVLVVDDSPVDRRLVEGLLKRDPFIQPELAESGSEALKLIERERPKLILTDLVMPEMDGLEFVHEVVSRFTSVPVVVMTAHGSGAVAAEALKAGAASYIPKSQLGERLLGTVQRVMGMLRGDYNVQRLVQYQTRAEYTFELESKANLIDPLIGLVHETASAARFGNSRTRLQIAVALEQALLNALYHGSLEIDAEQMQELRALPYEKVKRYVDERRSMQPFEGRTIYVDILIAKTEARITVRDEGPGFDVSSLRHEPDHSDFESRDGQGLVLMRTFMDELQFNDRGNEVVMIKRQ